MLTDIECRTARPRPSKAYRIPDGDGLHLRVGPTGTKSWQLDYRLDGLDQVWTIGKYPAIGLQDARLHAAEGRKAAATGVHLTQRKRERGANRRAERKSDRENKFKTVRDDWITAEAKRKRWSEDYIRQVRALFTNHLATLDAVPVTAVIAKITAPYIQRVERSAPYMVEKVERALDAVMDHAVRRGMIDRNPLPRRRPAKIQRRNFPAVVDLQGLGEILRAARATDPCKGIVRAHHLLVFTAQRVSEVVGATWAEFDLDGATWSIPRSRMKRRDEKRGPHDLPLPPKLLAMLREWRQADSGATMFVCPAPRDPAGKHITPEAIEKWMRDTMKLTGVHSPHSWRSAFSTVCRDAGKDADAIESQLDHVVGNSVQSAYDRAKRLELRRPLIRWYEATLIAARDGAKVQELRGKRA